MLPLRIKHVADLRAQSLNIGIQKTGNQTENYQNNQRYQLYPISLQWLGQAGIRRQIKGRQVAVISDSFKNIEVRGKEMVTHNDGNSGQEEQKRDNDAKSNAFPLLSAKLHALLCGCH